MKVFEFQYHGGEITAFVKAETFSEAVEMLAVGEVVGIEISYWYLHKECWQYVDEQDLEEAND